MAVAGAVAGGGLEPNLRVIVPAPFGLQIFPSALTDFDCIVPIHVPVHVDLDLPVYCRSYSNTCSY